MPKLRRHRRDHRARAPKSRKRRNLVKFIPEADRDFAFTASDFASHIRRNAEVCNISVEEVAEIDRTVKGFREAFRELLQARVGKGQSPQLRMRKDAARAKAEEMVRRFGNIIRADPTVPEMNKTLLRLKAKPKKLGKRKCPKTPPSLQFLGSGDGVAGGVGIGSGSGVHVIRFFDEEQGATLVPSKVQFVARKAKPDGAVRVELFFDMIPVGEAVPQVPNARGWPKYLNSYTRSPMEVDFPIPSEPMLFVYWARWAGSGCDVSRWSKPCVARVEGWTSHALPQARTAMLENGQRTLAAATRVETKYVYIQTPIAGELPDGLEGDRQAREIAALSERRMLEHEASRVPQ